MGNSVQSLVASALIPPDVLQGLANATPDAVEVGAYGQASLNLRNPFIGLTAYGGFELLGSLKTGRGALYGYYGAGVTVLTTATSGGFGGNVGLVFNCPSSMSYTENFIDLTIPIGSLTQAIRTKIQTGLSGIDPTSTGAGIPAAYASLLSLLDNIAGSNGYSADTVIAIFWAPSTPHVFGASLGVPTSWSSGASSAR